MQETLPKPTDRNVEILQVEAHDTVALKFSGPVPSQELIEKKRQELIACMEVRISCVVLLLCCAWKGRPCRQAGTSCSGGR